MSVVSDGTIMNDDYAPDRGDIIWINLDPRTGHEQSGRRPALVLSPSLFSRRVGLAIVCPITTKPKGLLFETPLKNTTTKGVGLPIHVRSVDFTARKIKFIEKAPTGLVNEVAHKVGLIIGI